MVNDAFPGWAGPGPQARIPHPVSSLSYPLGIVSDMTLDSIWVSPLKASRLHLRTIWGRSRRMTWIVKVDSESPLRLHPNSSQFKKWFSVTKRVLWTIVTTFVVTILVVDTFDSWTSFRPVAGSVAVALFAGLVGLILGPAAKVLEEYREWTNDLMEIVWELVAAADAGRSPIINEGSYSPCWSTGSLSWGRRMPYDSSP